MAKLTLTDITSGYQVASTTNANYAAIEAALENTLSRDGTTPNTMSADLDMNNQRIINLPDASNNSEPVTLGQAATIQSFTGVVATQGAVGAVLYPQSAAETTAAVTPSDYSYPWGDVRRYGALVNNSTDDTTAIQNAINSTHDVLLGAGTSVITAALTLDNAGQKIVGRGKGVSILKQTTVNVNGIDIQADNVLVADLQVQDITQNDAAEYWGIFTNGAYDGIEIRSCKVATSDDAGIRIGYNTGTGAPATNARVINCDVDNVTAGSGIEIIRGDDVLVQGCTITGTYQHGIRLAGAQRVRCVGNYIHQWAEQGSGAAISVQGAGDGGSITEGVSRITLTGNQGQLGTSITQTGTRSAFLVQDEAEDVSISGNVFDLTDTTGSTNIYGFLVRENAASATYAVKDLVISGNIIQGDLSFGGLLTSEIENALITGNVIRGFDDYGLRITGSDTVTGKAHGNIFIDGTTPTATFQDLGAGSGFIFGANQKPAESETATGTFTASLHIAETAMDSSGGAVTVTIPDGEYEGQRKIISMSDATNSSTASVTSHETSDPEVFTFAQTTDYLVLEWSESQQFWWTVKNIGAVV